MKSLINHALELWPLENENVKCNSSDHENLESSYNGQYSCQEKCLRIYGCVGIFYSYNQSLLRHCGLCIDKYSDVLVSDKNGFGFYRNIESKYKYTDLIMTI